MVGIPIDRLCHNHLFQERGCLSILDLERVPMGRRGRIRGGEAFK